MRTRFLVCYDVTDPKRLARVHKALCGYGEWLQLSIFACDLTPRRRVELAAALNRLIDLRQDRVMVIDLGPSEGRGSTSIEYMGTGPKLRKPPETAVI